MIAGILSFVIWYLLTGDLSTATERLVTVLVIACPHALGLAIPLVVSRSTSLASSQGLLVRNRLALEQANKIDTLALDKTGTLTEGNFTINEYTNDDILQKAASIEQYSKHPLARSIVSLAKQKQLQLWKASNVQNVAGSGIQGRINGHVIGVFSAKYLQEKGFKIDLAKFNQAATTSFIVEDEKVIGHISQGDKIRPESKQMVTGLKELGLSPVMLTGDGRIAAASVADNIGINDFHYQLLPADKENIIAQYQKDNKKVAMVGDGINDAPSLTRADLGIAIGAGTDIAIDSADVILIKSNPLDIINFFKLAKASSRKMTENLWWGAGYNLFAIPLAAGLLAPIGIVLSPAAGAILMALSTVIVSINALTLKKLTT
ncbi:hypothetical protein Q757_06045, partial [Oenococcus alcoholitolerans]